MTFLISGVQSLSSGFLCVFSLSCACWVAVMRVQFRLPYWSMMWSRNWIMWRCVRIKGVLGFSLPYL